MYFYRTFKIVLKPSERRALAAECRDAFCNVASKAYNFTTAERGLLAGSGLQEVPLMLLDVIASDGQRMGILIDLASDTNYNILRTRLPAS